MKLSNSALSSVFFPALALLVLLTNATTIQAEELLRNPSFANGSQHWRTPSSISDWYPFQSDVLTGGHVNLHPPDSWMGTVLRQSLNVDGIAGQEVFFSGKLRKNASSAGNTLSFRLRYISNTDEIREIELVSPSNASIGDWTQVQGSFAFPGDARKLTAFLVYKVDYGDFDADDLSLSGTSLTPGPIPLLNGDSTYSGPFGTEVALTGTLLGETPGVLMLNDSPDGISIQSWSASQVTTTVSDPARGGAWALFVDGVEADGDYSFQLTSPHYLVRAVGTLSTFP